MLQSADLTLIILVAIVAGIPILGITSRMAVRTIVEALIDLQESLGEKAASDGVELRLARLEEEIRALSRSIQAAKEAGPPRSR
jgi:hypothetical protein